jgi:hypothetical protein
MIVPSMAITEIKNELLKDAPTLIASLVKCGKEFRRRVLKASHYPFTYTYDCCSRTNKNHFILVFTVLKRGDKDNPLVSIYGLYNRSEGVYAVSLRSEGGRTFLYPPHFFRRYRERIVKDFSTSNRDLIRSYISTNTGIVFATVNQGMETVYVSFEHKITAGSVGFVCATAAGYCFGEKHGDIFIMKTIVSEDMLFESQKEVFSSLRKDFIEVYKEFYRKSIF